MKTIIHAAFHSFGVAACIGVALLVPAVARAQNLFVSAGFNGSTVTEITPGGTESTFASGLSNPRGLAFNSAGILFVSDNGSGNIYEYTPGGAQSLFASGLSVPWGLAFNSAGNLFVSDNSSGKI